MIHDTYCSYPFDSLAVKRWSNGKPFRITPCCNMLIKGNDDPMNVKHLADKDNNLLTIFNGKEFSKLRSDLLNGIRHSACEYCWKLEDKIGDSPRTVEISKIDEPITQPKLKKFDTMLDENCNLRCRMCTPACSNSLRKDVALIKSNNLTMPEYFVPSISSTVDKDPQGKMTFKAPSDANQKQLVELCNTNLEEIKFTGGEPTTSSTFWRVIDNIEHPENIILNITTNGTKFNEKFVDAVKRFKHNKFTISIDGTNKTYGYIRYPFQWQKLIKNIERLCNKLEEGKLEINFCSVLTIYNILDIKNLIHWIHQHNKKSVHMINFNCIVDPHPVDSCLDIKWASKALLNIAYKNLQDILQNTNHLTNRHTKRVHDYIKWCMDQQHDPKYLKERRQKLLLDTTTFDQIRNQSYKDILDLPVVNFIDSI